MFFVNGNPKQEAITQIPTSGSTFSPEHHFLWMAILTPPSDGFLKLTTNQCK
jgi:hypothetical protein